MAVQNQLLPRATCTLAFELIPQELRPVPHCTASSEPLRLNPIGDKVRTLHNIPVADYPTCSIGYVPAVRYSLEIASCRDSRI